MDHLYYRKNRRNPRRTRSAKPAKSMSFYLFPFIGVLLVFLLTQLFSIVSDSFQDDSTLSLENALVVKAMTGNISYTDSNNLSGNLNLSDLVFSGTSVVVPFDSALVLESNKGSEFRIDQSSNFTYEFVKNDGLDLLELKFKAGRVWVNSKNSNETINLASNYINIQSQNSVLSYKSNLPEVLNIFLGQALAEVKDQDTQNVIDKFRVESNTSILLDNQSYSDFLVNKAPLIKTKTASDVYLSNWYKWNTFYDNNGISISFDDIFEDDSNIAFKDLQSSIETNNKDLDNKSEIQNINKSTTPYFTFPKDNEVITQSRIKLTGKVPANTAKVMIISYEEDEPFKYILKEFEANSEDFVYYAFSDPERGNLFPGINKFEVVAIDNNGKESPSSYIEFVYRDPNQKIDTSKLELEDKPSLIDDSINDSTAQSNADNKNEITDNKNLVSDSNLALPVIKTINDIAYQDNFELNTSRAYLVGEVPNGATKVTINGFDLTMFQKGQTRFHYILSQGFNNLKEGTNTLNITYEKDGIKSPPLKVNIIYKAT